MSKTTTKTTKTINYKSEVISLINDLSIINQSIILDKDDETNKVTISRSNPAKTLAYKLETDSENFDFDGESLAFYNFPDFYQLFSCFENPTMKQSGRKIIMSKDSSKINYLISSDEGIKKGPKKVAFQDPVISFELPLEILKEFNKMIGLLTAENIRLTYNQKNMKIEIFNKGHDNSFIRTLESSTDYEENFEMVISKEIFVNLPLTEDYTADIAIFESANGPVGGIRFTLNSQDVNLELFTAEISTEEN